MKYIKKYRACISVGFTKEGRPIIDDDFIRDINHTAYVEDGRWERHKEDFEGQPRYKALGEAKWYHVEVEYDEVTGRINAIDPNETT